jgi:hypothetical protein
MPSLPLNPSIARNAPMALALDDRRAMFDFGRYQRAPEIAGSFGPPGGNGVAEHHAASAAHTPKGDEGKIEKSRDFVEDFWRPTFVLELVEQLQADDAERNGRGLSVELALDRGVNAGS